MAVDPVMIVSVSRAQILHTVGMMRAPEARMLAECIERSLKHGKLLYCDLFRDSESEFYKFWSNEAQDWFEEMVIAGTTIQSSMDDESVVNAVAEFLQITGGSPVLDLSKLLVVPSPGEPVNAKIIGVTNIEIGITF